MAFNTANTNYTFHNPANEFCDGLSRRLKCSNANDVSVYAPLFASAAAGKAARHNSIETSRTNQMDLGGVLNQVTFPGQVEALEAHLVYMTFKVPHGFGLLPK